MFPKFCAALILRQAQHKFFCSFVIYPEFIEGARQKDMQALRMLNLRSADKHVHRRVYEIDPVNQFCKAAR
ncbi:hypothetical protein ATO12_02460 [Aquimarina atlantica]|uniref:Uncharacterized protein n=1 Tax=Aquimarina atlantica TaxID=1317122 RepID=A0A023C036_9FLAO|nr:hypothetical protein ATO12_02460 [Aquimarina atlantica]